MKKLYAGPTVVLIGQLTAYTGEFKDGQMLDNSNGSNAWKIIAP